MKNRALRCFVYAAAFTLGFYGFAINVKSIFIIGPLGLIATVLIASLVSRGFHILFFSKTLEQAEIQSRPIVAVALLLVMPLFCFCALHYFKNMSRYTITVDNASDHPMESVTLATAMGRTTQTLGIIPAGDSVKASFDVRDDEEGVRLRSIWQGRQFDRNVTRYLLWEQPENFKVKLGMNGEVVVNGKHIANVE